MRDHHLLPQEFVEDVAIGLGISNSRARDFVDRTIARIPNAEHIALHANHYNAAWEAWFVARPTGFTVSDVRAQIRVMMARYGIASSTTNQPRYCR
jgi:hypothetical protein